MLLAGDPGRHAAFHIDGAALPETCTLQDHFCGRGLRKAAGDELVPVSCFRALSFTIELAPGQGRAQCLADRCAQAVAVNAVGFTGRLPHPLLHDVIHNSLPSRTLSWPRKG